MANALRAAHSMISLCEKGSIARFDNLDVHMNVMHTTSMVQVRPVEATSGRGKRCTLRQAFLSGQTAMMWHTTGNLTAVKNDAEFDFGVAMLPANVQPGSPTGGGNFYLFKGSSEEEQQAALALIKYMTAPERAAEWSIATGYVGISPAAYETPALQAYVEGFPQALVARDQLEVAIPEFSTYETARVREALNNAIQATLTGSKTAEEALSEAQATAERLLRPYQ